jgi:hypothetical protein
VGRFVDSVAKLLLPRSGSIQHPIDSVARKVDCTDSGLEPKGLGASGSISRDRVG